MLPHPQPFSLGEGSRKVIRENLHLKEVVINICELKFPVWGIGGELLISFLKNLYF
jgi:hypothetical protein